MGSAFATARKKASERDAARGEEGDGKKRKKKTTANEGATIRRCLEGKEDLHPLHLAGVTDQLLREVQQRKGKKVTGLMLVRRTALNRMADSGRIRR